MEYFVDEMPRDCASCKHYHINCADGYSCSKLRKEIHPNFSEGMGYRHQDCPLQSLIDYTKQVRKEVCEKIIKFINELAWKDVKYDAYQSTMGEFTGSTSAIPRYAKKYFDLWEEMFNEKLEQIEKGE